MEENSRFTVAMLKRALDGDPPPLRSEIKPLWTVEILYIYRAIKTCNYDLRLAAKQLDTSYETVELVAELARNAGRIMPCFSIVSSARSFLCAYCKRRFTRRPYQYNPVHRGKNFCTREHKLAYIFRETQESK